VRRAKGGAEDVRGILRAELREETVKEARSGTRFVEAAVEIKGWVLPGVDQGRPPRCPGCGAGSRVPGARLGLQGHGVRRRQVRGPVEPDGPPQIGTVVLRRYRCVTCNAVVMVGPRGLLRRYLYAAPAIGWALALYGVARHTAAQVRRRVSPWSVVGDAAAGRWATLRRWIKAVAQRRLLAGLRRSRSDATPRQVAEAAATTLAGWARGADRGTPLGHRAWQGAAQLARAIAI